MESDLSWAVAAVITLPVTAIMIFSGLFAKGLAERAADGRVGRNRLAGLRTPATLASDEAWSAGQQAALADTVRGGELGAWISALALVVAWGLGALGVVGPEGTVVIWTIVLLTGVVVMAGLLVRGAIRGNAAAKAVNQS